MDLSWLRTNLLLAQIGNIKDNDDADERIESSKDGGLDGLSADKTESEPSNHTNGPNLTSKRENHSQRYAMIYQASNDIMRQALTSIHQQIQSCFADSEDHAYNIENKVALDILKSAVNCLPTKESLSSDMEYANLVLSKCRQLTNEFRSLMKKYHDLNHSDNERHKSMLRNLEQEFQSKYEQEKAMLLKEVSLKQRIYEERTRIVLLEYQRKLASRDQEFMQLQTRYNEFCHKHNSERTDLTAQIQKLEDALKSEQAKGEQLVEEQNHLHRKKLIEISSKFESEKIILLARIDDLEDRLMNRPSPESSVDNNSSGQKLSRYCSLSALTDEDVNCCSQSYHLNLHKPAQMKDHLTNEDFDSIRKDHSIRRRQPVPLRDVDLYAGSNSSS